MTTVYFVRHAAPDFRNHDDLTRGLSVQGLQDRRLVTDFLWDKGIDAVLSSPFKRAVDTVKEFADAKGMEIKLVDDFRERKIGNEWIDDFDDFSKRQWADFDFRRPDGESLREVQRRNIDALARVLREYAGKNVAIGSHGTALSTILNYFDPTFGYNGFYGIKKRMPWIVRFSFEDGGCMDLTPARCREIQKYNVFV